MNNQECASDVQKSGAVVRSVVEGGLSRALGTKLRIFALELSCTIAFANAAAVRGNQPS